MKLQIDLSDREDMQAGARLLEKLLSATCEHTRPLDLAGTQAAGLAHMMTHGSPELDADAAKLEALAGPGAAGIRLHVGNVPDPAAVFAGGAAAPAPLAPSIPPAAVPSTNVPPPPASSAPTTPTLGAAVSAAPAASVELDAAGLPWDGRIHSSGKTKVKGDTWRYKGGVSPETIQKVEGELRAAMGAAPLASAPVAATVAAPVPPPPPSGSASSVPAAPPAVSADPTTFEQLMPRITAAVTSGLMPVSAAQEACAAQGLASIVALQQQPAFVPFVWASLKASYPAIQ